MKLQKLFFLTGVIFIGCTTSNNKHAQIKNEQQENAKHTTELRNILGTWVRNCNGGSGYISIQNLTEEATIEVNSNQIAIGAKIDTSQFHQNSIVFFRLITPDDLGSGGMNLHWDDFSKDSIIAMMTLLKDSSANFKWLGFYDIRKKERVWQHQLDLLLDSNGNETNKSEVVVINCDK